MLRYYYLYCAFFFFNEQQKALEIMHNYFDSDCQTFSFTINRLLYTRDCDRISLNANVILWKCYKLIFS